MGRLKKIILDWIFPEACVVCGREGNCLCQCCSKKIIFLEEQVCPECGQGECWGRTCPDCYHGLDGALSALDYDCPAVAALIKKFKYGGSERSGEILSRLLVNNIASKITLGRLSSCRAIDFNAPLLVPAPLSVRRRRERGFNQAKMLAAALQDKFNWEMSDNLKRTHYRQPQAALDRRERLKNLRDDFSWDGNSLAGRTVFIIDDVITTGSTLHACARPLKAAGAERIWGLTAAHG